MITPTSCYFNLYQVETNEELNDEKKTKQSSSDLNNCSTPIPCIKSFEMPPYIPRIHRYNKNDFAVTKKETSKVIQDSSNSFENNKNMPSLKKRVTDLKKKMAFDVSDIEEVDTFESDPFCAFERKMAPKDIYLPKTNLDKTFEESKKYKSYNRYRNVLPYDDNIYAPQTVIGRFYLNASKVFSCIATQAPLENTLAEFWMAVFAKSGAIFNLAMPQMNKCEDYWNQDKIEIKSKDGKEISLGEVRKKGNDEIIYFFESGLHTQKIVKREFEFYSYHENTGTLEKKPLKTVIHYHYENWPDKGVPNLDAFKVLLALLEEEIKKDSLPFIHCSAGIGRTGVLIALDHLYRQVREKIDLGLKPIVDPVALIKEMRNYRGGMVQTEEQLEFIYYCIHMLALEYAIKIEEMKNYSHRDHS